jgi:hypothetical protein
VRSIMSGCRLLALLSGVLIISMDGALACGNGKLLFEDKFEALDPAWAFSEDDSERSNGPGGLTYKYPPNVYINLLNEAGLYDNYEVCAVFVTEVPTGSNAYISVNFWASDFDNLYSADVYPAAGTYEIYRAQRSKALYPVSSRSNASIVKGTTATNEVSVTLNGSKATLAINGKKVIDFTGQPPEGGSVFGLSLGTGKNDTGPSTLTVKTIQVREVAAAPNP